MNHQQREMRFSICQEMYKIMGCIWINRIYQNELLSVQIRDMANWKPRYYYDDVPLVASEIARIIELADMAEKLGI